MLCTVVFQGMYHVLDVGNMNLANDMVKYSERFQYSLFWSLMVDKGSPKL